MVFILYNFDSYKYFVLIHYFAFNFAIYDYIQRIGRNGKYSGVDVNINVRRLLTDNFTRNIGFHARSLDKLFKILLIRTLTIELVKLKKKTKHNL